MKKLTIIITALLFGSEAFAMGSDDPLVASFNLAEFEHQFNSGDDATSWSAEVSLSNDLHGVTLASEGARVDPALDEHEVNLFYSRAVSPFWNLNLGWRGDVHPDPERNWLLVGADGELPFMIGSAVTLYLGNDRSILTLEFEKEIMLTQKWRLVPGMEAEFNGYNDEEVGAGSGFAGLEVAVRLAYEMTPHFSPYVGIHWERAYGNTADFIRAEGEDLDLSQFLVGFSFWF